MSGALHRMYEPAAQSGQVSPEIVTIRRYCPLDSWYWSVELAVAGDVCSKTSEMRPHLTDRRRLASSENDPGATLLMDTRSRRKAGFHGLG
jgi:hypothetical protein